MKAILRSGFLALAIAVMALAVPVNAGPFEDSVAAYDRGDYATALLLLRPLADQGNIWAQSNLGAMYAVGEGVPQDYVSAHMWFSLAATRGAKKAQTNRNIAARKMTPGQIAEAQRIAREWMAKHQQ